MAKPDLSHIAEPLRAMAVSVAELNPDPSNARKHNERNLDAIKASLAAFGQRKPIVVQREGMIVRAGNGTMAAAKALGWSHIAAVIIDDDNSTASQFAIADNRTAELAEWDNETLALLLDNFDSQEQDALGFNDKDLTEIMLSLEPESAEKSLGDAAIAGEDSVQGRKVYELVFDDEMQQAEFYEFLRHLKKVYPNGTSGTDRLMSFVRAHRQVDA